MAELSQSIAKARKAGYSDSEIVAYLGQDKSLSGKVAKARDAGYSDREIVAHLGKPNTLKDVATSFLSGAASSVGKLADDFIAGSSPVGTLNAALTFVGSKHKVPTAGNLLAQMGDGYTPETRVGRYSRAVGENVPNAVAPARGVAARVANVLAPAIAGEGAAQGAEAMGAGAKGQAVARIVGGVVGGAAASVRTTPRAQANGSPANILASRARQDPNAMRARAQEYRAAGINPTVVDVVDDSGRGAVRAAASRMTPARQQATNYQDTTALNLPGRMSTQARRTMSQDPRTPDQIRGEMTQQRTANANRSFGAVRGESLDLAPETVQALRNPLGRAAITEAARRERDPDIRAALNRLANDALDNPGGTQITVGMADRISRTLFGQAQAAARAGDNDLAATFNSLAESIRGPARTAVPGYANALRDFGADSRLQEAAGVGESLLERNTDEFVAAANALSDDERNLALAAGRRAIERKSGENIGAAPGVARTIANTPEQQARNNALMGPERAEQLQTGMRLEESRVRNANDIAPRFGTQTQNKTQDAAQMAAGIIQTGQRIARQDYLGIGIDWLRSRGMSDAQAQALVEAALDPNQVDQVIVAMEQRVGRQEAQRFLAFRNAAMGGAIAGQAAAPELIQ